MTTTRDEPTIRLRAGGGLDASVAAAAMLVLAALRVLVAVREFG